MVQFRLAEHHALGGKKVLGAAAFNHIGGQGEGGTGKTDKRYLEFAPQKADGFQHKRHILFRLRHPQGCGGLLVAHRLRKDRPPAIVELQGQAHGLHRNKDIGKKDGCIKVEDIHRLQGHCDAQVRIFTQFQKAERTAYPLVIGQITACLAHKPNRNMAGCFAFAGLKKGGVHAVPEEFLEKREIASSLPERRIACQRRG